MISFIKNLFKSCRLSNAFSNGYNLNTCTYEIGTDLYLEWKSGYDLRKENDIRDMDILYTKVCSIRPMHRVEFDKLVSFCNINNLKFILDNCHKNTREIQVGGAFYMSSYDTEIKIMKEIGYNVSEVRYGFGAYTRICLRIEKIN